MEKANRAERNRIVWGLDYIKISQGKEVWFTWGCHKMV